MSKNIAKDRVSSIDTLDYNQIAINDGKVISDLKNILPLLQNSDSGQISMIARIDTSNKDEAEIQNWLRSLKLTCEQANLYWTSYRKGVRIQLETFFQHYSDLWYPSSDDVLVTDDQLTWILEMDHEELFSLWKVKLT